MKRLLTSAALFLCSLITFAQFSGSGSGTEEDPYLILNPVQLNQLRNFLGQSNVYFKLMADIDLTEFLEDENPTQGWQPVGNSSAKFQGILDFRKKHKNPRGIAPGGKMKRKNKISSCLEGSILCLRLGLMLQKRF